MTKWTISDEVQAFRRYEVQAFRRYISLCYGIERKGYKMKIGMFCEVNGEAQREWVINHGHCVIITRLPDEKNGVITAKSTVDDVAGLFMESDLTPLKIVAVGRSFTCSDGCSIFNDLIGEEVIKNNKMVVEEFFDKLKEPTQDDLDKWCLDNYHRYIVGEGTKRIEFIKHLRGAFWRENNPLPLKQAADTVDNCLPFKAAHSLWKEYSRLLEEAHSKRYSR